jgi:Predicted membrane protein
MSNYNNSNYQNQSPYTNPPQNNQPPIYSPPQYQPQTGIEPPPGYQQKSRIAAGLLAIFAGMYGLHSFYMGNTSRGLTQVLISLLGCGVGPICMMIWGIVDGVKILDGRINTDSYGIFLKD